MRNIYFTETGYQNYDLSLTSENIAIIELSEKIVLSPSVYPACVNWGKNSTLNAEDATIGQVSCCVNGKPYCYKEDLWTTHLEIEYSLCNKLVLQLYQPPLDELLTPGFVIGATYTLHSRSERFSNTNTRNPADDCSTFFQP